MDRCRMEDARMEDRLLQLLQQGPNRSRVMASARMLWFRPIRAIVVRRRARRTASVRPQNRVRSVSPRG